VLLESSLILPICSTNPGFAVVLWEVYGPAVALSDLGGRGGSSGVSKVRLSQFPIL
jgi:hypothetical protein